MRNNFFQPLDSYIFFVNKINSLLNFPGLFWKAPELLRDNSVPTVAGDIYAFGIILYEIMGRKGPFGGIDVEPKGKHIILTIRLR